MQVLRFLMKLLFFHLLLSLHTWFISSEKKPAVYELLGEQYLIKIPVHLPGLRSMSHAGPLWWHHTVVLGSCSWPTCWPLPLLQNPIITASRCPHSGKLILSAFRWEFFKSISVYSIPLSLNTLTLFCCLLCVYQWAPRVLMTFWDFGATCNFPLHTACISFLYSSSVCLLTPCRLNPDRSLLKV